MTEPHGASSRREFLKATLVAAAALAIVPNAHAAGADGIKVGLIGCGGRGSGAVENLCEAMGDDTGVTINALGDAFPDNLGNARSNFASNPKIGPRLKVTDDKCFVGFDAYKKVIDSGVDMVILATPPGFRPMMIEAAVNAGKNIFTEKPVGVDGPRHPQASSKAAEDGQEQGPRRRGRHPAPPPGRLHRVHEAHPRRRHRRPHRRPGLLEPGASLEQGPPVKLVGHGVAAPQLAVLHLALGRPHRRAARPQPRRGQLGLRRPPRPRRGHGRPTGPHRPRSTAHIFDHFAIDYEYPNNVHVMSMARQIEGTEGNVSETIVGSKGTFRSGGYRISGPNKFSFRAKEVNPYVQEHIDLIASIRAGKPLNELVHRGREHPHGDHGPDVRLHRQGRDLG